ncbi:MAG TPA: acyl-CoA dehydrogenase family protein [Allosphingosinicella sp.]|nr:acyl-CoA dehydrogenase family protein [Allosphingosinicella sp.]
MLTAYEVPLEDIRFALRPVAGAAGTDESTLAQILTEAGRFAVDRLIPLNLAGDRAGVRLEGGEAITPAGFAQAYRDWAAAGWMGVSIPESWGGSGLSPLVTAPLDEIWNGANMSFYVCPTLTQAALKLILAHGSDEQKQAYVPNLAAGLWTASMGLTEPQAGSDLSLLTTRAIPAANGSHRLFGAKIFTSFGAHDWTDNIVHLVLARVEGAPAGSRGISLFIVPGRLPDGGRNDALCTGVEHKLGLHASPTCAMAYGEAGEGATGWLLGPPNAGLATMFVMMNKARIACALQSVGLAERALQQARAYAEGRLQGRGPGGTVAIGAHPDVKRMLARMAALTQATRTLTYGTVAAVEAEAPDAGPGGRGGLLTPLAKIFASEAACEVAALNIQVHGGMGYVEETGAAQFLRDARAIPIYEGTNGIQAIDLVQRKLVPDGGAALDRELEAIDRLADAGDGFAARLGIAVDETRRAAAWLLAPERADEDRLAAAAPFAALAGATIAGGTLAAALQAADAEGGASESQRRAALHYGDAILSMATGQAEATIAAPRSL